MGRTKQLAGGGPPEIWKKRFRAFREAPQRESCADNDDADRSDVSEEIAYRPISDPDISYQVPSANTDVEVTFTVSVGKRSAEDAKVIQEFASDQVAALLSVLRYGLRGMNMKLLGNTFKEFANNQRLMRALSNYNDRDTKLQEAWKTTLFFLDNVSLHASHNDDCVVIFRMSRILGENMPLSTSENTTVMSDFKVYTSLLMSDFFFPLLGPDVEGVFSGGGGWIQFKRNWIIAQNQRYKHHTNWNPIVYQVQVMNALVAKLNKKANTQWRCRDYSNGIVYQRKENFFRVQ
jgi:hypothetical protein